MPPSTMEGVEVVGDSLAQGSSLRPGQALRSSNGRFTLALQRDGKLVLWGEAPTVMGMPLLAGQGLHQVLTGGMPLQLPQSLRGSELRHGLGMLLRHGPAPRTPAPAAGPVTGLGEAGQSASAQREVLWASESAAGSRSPGRLTMHEDGDLVAYDAPGNRYWTTGTRRKGTGPYKLVMQNDGNAVVYGLGRATWDTGTWATARNRFKGDSLVEGSRLHPGEAIRSPGGRFTFVFQTDANVVLYDWGKPLWSSNTFECCQPGHLIMQHDGNLVACDAAGRPYWASDTWQQGTGPYRFAMQDDAKAVLYNRNGNCLWETGTRRENAARTRLVVRPAKLAEGDRLLPGQSMCSSNGAYCLKLHEDGNITVLKGDRTLWESETSNRCSPKHLIMQSDGNLVAYDVRNNPYWASHTCDKGTGPFRLDMQDDGNCVIYQGNGEPTWATDTWKTANVTIKGNSLAAGARLKPNEALCSSNGRFILVFQTDANVVLYHGADPLWASNTWQRCTPGHLTMQRDGNLVAHDSRGRAYWSTGTSGRSGTFKLMMKNDGNAMLFEDEDGNPKWETGTAEVVASGIGQEDVAGGLLMEGAKLSPGQALYSDNRRYRLVFQEDANVVLYDVHSRALWSSDTWRHASPPGYLIMQSDGNLVAYNRHRRPYWATDTWGQGTGPFKLVVSDSGEVAVYAGDGQRTWEGRCGDYSSDSENGDFPEEGYDEPWPHSLHGSASPVPVTDINDPGPARLEAHATPGGFQGAEEHHGDATETQASEGSGDPQSSCCVICYVAPRQGVCVPCGHMSSCMSCLNLVQRRDRRCPICRSEIQQVVKVFQV